MHDGTLLLYRREYFCLLGVDLTHVFPAPNQVGGRVQGGAGREPRGRAQHRSAGCSGVIRTAIRGAVFGASPSVKVDVGDLRGCLIKGETMHFDYICEAVSQGIMKLGLDSGVPIVFGVLTCLTEQQAMTRAGLVKGGHNHGLDWGKTAIEMALLKRSLLQPVEEHAEVGEKGG